MSHVFISYSHKDVYQRDALIKVLQEANIPYWYDTHIEGGRDWRDEIDVALKESFVVVVIITADSLGRHFVTYEWSWAIGNGTPLVPLFFENLSIKDIHAPLARHQYIECLNGIPERVIETLKLHQNLPPDTLYLSTLILNAVLPLRVLSRFTFWIYPFIVSGLFSLDIFQRFSQRVEEEAMKLHYQILPSLMVDKSSAFTMKQIRTCRKLIEHMKDFIDKIGKLVPPPEPIKSFLDWNSIDMINFIKAAENSRITIVEDGINSFGLIDNRYESFDSYLNQISKGDIPDKFWIPAIDAVFESQVSGLSLEDISIIQEAIGVVLKSISSKD